MCLPSCRVWSNHSCHVLLITVAMCVYLVATCAQLQLPCSKESQLPCVCTELPRSRNCSSVAICVPSCHVRITAVAIHKVVVSCGRKAVRPHPHDLVGGCVGETQFAHTAQLANSVVRACGQTLQRPHTSPVLRGTQNQPFRAKIRAKGIER